MRFRSVSLLMFLLIFIPGLAHAEKRIALVIGNAAYKNAATLQNPRNDATDVSEALKRLGFETIVGLDLDRAGMEDATIKFARAAQDADVALVYYSGHAMQRRGINYLMPVDAGLHDEADLRRLTRVDEIVDDLSQAKNLRILVLDACRVNPLADELNRSIELTRGPPVERGIARMIAAKGMIISFATQPGQTAADGQGRNSPYTMAFLKNIETTEEIGEVFHHVTADVYNETQGKQLPELSLSVVGDFYLKGPTPTALPTAPLVQPSTEAAQAWAAAQATTSEAVLDAFIKRFGDSFYAALAQARLEELRKNRSAALAPPAPAPASQKPPPAGATPVAVVAPPVVPLAAPCKSGSAIMASLSSRPACPLSDAEERSLKPKDAFRECDKCPEMVVVPAGSFRMGSPASEEGRNDDESPQHLVTISDSFAVSRFEVTFDEWDACVADGGCNGYKPEDEGWGRGRRPVINVSWDDAKAYVAWLWKKTGKVYGLLSEAEREYVTRAGTTTPFWWGSSISTTQANYNGNYIYGGKSKGENRRETVPVDSFEPNAFGLYQVHGNVWEWVEDCSHDNYTGAPSDGSAWLSGDCKSRVLRGGSWNQVPGGLRAANRDGDSKDIRSVYYGFRLGRTL
jgi:formylglycine-generating enzyme required for sulfatase activity/uncharacterized caspase-like protein